VAQALLKKAINQGALTPRQLRTPQQTLAHLYASLEVGTGSKVLSQQITTTTNGDSLQIAYTYNDQGLVTVINEDRPSVVMSPIDTTSYTYNAAGQILTVNTIGREESNTYNTAGQPLTRATDGNVEFAATYDDKGNLLELTVGGNTAIFTYDDNGNVLTEDINNDGTIDITYQYDNNGRVILEDRGAISTQFSYDNNGNLRTEFDPDSVVDAVRYNYDSSGNRISSEGCNRQTANSADEIINSTDCSVRTTTTYDDNGNELIVFSPQKDQKISETRYDDKGNKIFYEDENGLFVSYQFDAAGKLVLETLAELTVGTPNPLHVITYSYDADGNLVTEVFQYLNQAGGYTTTYEYVDNNALVSIPDFSVGNGPLFDNSLEADVKRNGVVYDLGDTGPGGGIVFYTDFNGYYLEAAPTDVIPAADTNEFSFRGGCDAETPDWTGVEAWSAFGRPQESVDTIGNGKSNTALFIAKCPNDIDGTNFAPQAADSYISENVTDDWFLPSIGELNQLFAYTFPSGLNSNVANNNGSVSLNIVPGLSSIYYSSTQYTNVLSVFIQDMSTENTSPLSKLNVSRSVRPVREFRAGSYPPD
jgi:YD repeat-containing protein